MKKLGITTVIAVAAAAVTASAFATTNVRTVPFTAKYSGTAVVKVTDQVADISATGAGTGTLSARGRSPPLALGGPRWHTGTTRTIVFRKAGIYRIVARNVQSSADLGLQTLGDDSPLTLTVRVTR